MLSLYEVEGGCALVVRVASLNFKETKSLPATEGTQEDKSDLYGRSSTGFTDTFTIFRLLHVNKPPPSIGVALCSIRHQ